MGVGREGLIYPDPAGQGSGTDDWRWRLSSLGIEAATGGAPGSRVTQRGTFSVFATTRELSTPQRWVKEALPAINPRCYLSTAAMLGVAYERGLDGLPRSVVRTAGGSAKELLEALDNARLQPTEHVNPSWPHHDGLEWTQEGGPAVWRDGVRCSGRHSLTGILTGRVLRDAQTDVSPLTCQVPGEGSAYDTPICRPVK